ncbi:hypothetical protein EDD18DRAFT_1355710 [Armillaria luteobubalina]|uniref:Uncharacterized protein n=1 Tax=Armillaria luteobubalina TaxID=153913 RepID=A0AA39Q135_9AGAR|nr:hypothetical protein EDD18DRAFT_1355710 [Armillaria luteobubalina]
MSSNFDTQQGLHDATSRSPNFKPGRTIPSIPSNVTVVYQVAFYYDCYETPGSGKAMFQLIRNNHEVIIWGPPVIEHLNLMIQLELIGTLLDSVPFNEIREAILYIAWDACARLIPLKDKHFQIPYWGGYRCVEESQLQVTDWLQVGWKLALMDGVRPVEVEYAYNLTSSLALQYMINGCRNLEPLDLTTPVLACLAHNGHMIGLVKCIEEGAQTVSYKDRRLVYSAFQKMQEHHIYLLDGHDMDPSAILIANNKVRFVDMALKRWFNPNVLIYDRMVHDEQELEQVWQAHWRQVELLFERLNTYPSTSHRQYRPPEYCILDILSVLRMSFLMTSACLLVEHKRQKRHRQRSNEPQISPNTVCGREYLHGRHRSALTQRRRIAPTWHECVYDRRPDSHCILNSEQPISPSRLPSSRSIYSPPNTPYDPPSPTTCIPQHHRIFYSDHSSPSPLYIEGDILESGWLEEIESACSS